MVYVTMRVASFGMPMSKTADMSPYDDIAMSSPGGMP